MPVISQPFLEYMKRQGMRIREYRLAPGERVACTIRADDDAVVSRMQVPLAGVKRVDALQSLDLGDGRLQQWRLEDVPFDPKADEVLSLPSAAAAEEVAGPYVPRPTRRGGRVGRAVARRVHVRAHAELMQARRQAGRVHDQPLRPADGARPGLGRPASLGANA